MARMSGSGARRPRTARLTASGSCPRWAERRARSCRAPSRRPGHRITTRIAVPRPRPGDPIFVADRNGAESRQTLRRGRPASIKHYLDLVARRPLHLLRARNPVPDDMDIWRIPSAGGDRRAADASQFARRLSRACSTNALWSTSATREDGSGSGLYAMDIERRIPHAVSSGLEEYISRRPPAPTAGGSWRPSPIRPETSGPSRSRTTSSTIRRQRASSCRRTRGRTSIRARLLRLSLIKGGADGLWKFKDGVETELWKGSDGAVSAAPAVSPDGTQIGFVVRREGRALLYVMASDGTERARIAETLDVRDTPSWSPDGKWIAVVAARGRRRTRSSRYRWTGGAPVRLVDGVNRHLQSGLVTRRALHPVLRGQGRSDASGFEAVTPDGQPFPTARDLRSGTRETGIVSAGREETASSLQGSCGIRTSGCWIFRPGACGS